MAKLYEEGRFSVEVHTVFNDGHVVNHKGKSLRNFDTLGDAMDAMDSMLASLRNWYHSDRPENKYFDILVFDDTTGELMIVRTSEHI